MVDRHHHNDSFSMAAMPVIRNIHISRKVLYVVPVLFGKLFYLRRRIVKETLPTTTSWLGAPARTDDPISLVQKTSVVQEMVHPDYDDTVYEDYMIVMLDKKVTNHHLEMVGLAGNDMPLKGGDQLVAMGFDDTAQSVEGEQSSKILQELNLHYVSDTKCRDVNGKEPSFDGQYMFFAQSQDENPKYHESGS